MKFQNNESQGFNVTAIAKRIEYITMALESMFPLET